MYYTHGRSDHVFILTIVVGIEGLEESVEVSDIVEVHLDAVHLQHVLHEVLGFWNRN